MYYFHAAIPSSVTSSVQRLLAPLHAPNNSLPIHLLSHSAVVPYRKYHAWMSPTPDCESHCCEYRISIWLRRPPSPLTFWLFHVAIAVNCEQSSTLNSCCHSHLICNCANHASIEGS